MFHHFVVGRYIDDDVSFVVYVMGRDFVFGGHEFAKLWRLVHVLASRGPGLHELAKPSAFPPKLRFCRGKRSLWDAKQCPYANLRGG